MRSDDVPGGIKMGGTTQTQGGEEMSHTQTQTEEEEMQPIRREQKWAIILHTAEKTKLGIELGVVQVEDLEEMIIDMISGALEQLKGILASGHEVACMVSWSMITIKVIEMEEHSRAHLKEDLLSGKAASVETPDVGLLGIPGGSCETKYGFIVFERMKDGCGWRSCIHQRCGERWITDESCPLQSDEEMRKLVFEAADLFRWAKRNKPSDPGFFDCQLSAHIDKTVREIISSTEMTIVGSLVTMEMCGVNFDEPEQSNTKNVFEKVCSAEFRNMVDSVMVGPLERSGASSSIQRYEEGETLEVVRAGKPNRAAGLLISDDAMKAVHAGFWGPERGGRQSRATTTLAMRDPKGLRGMEIDDGFDVATLSTKERLGRVRATPLGDLLESNDADMFTLMKGFFVLEVQEIAKVVAVFRLYDVGLALGDQLAITVQQNDNRITFTKNIDCDGRRFKLSLTSSALHRKLATLSAIAEACSLHASGSRGSLGIRVA
eukprot:g10147.t1